MSYKERKKNKTNSEGHQAVRWLIHNEKPGALFLLRLQGNRQGNKNLPFLLILDAQKPNLNPKFGSIKPLFTKMKLLTGRGRRARWNRCLQFSRKANLLEFSCRWTEQTCSSALLACCCLALTAFPTSSVRSQSSNTGEYSQAYDVQYTCMCGVQIDKIPALQQKPLLPPKPLL